MPKIEILDLDSCKNALIINSKFYEDDGVWIKSGKDEDGRKRNRSYKNIVVEGCKLFSGNRGFIVEPEWVRGEKY